MDPRREKKKKHCKMTAADIADEQDCEVCFQSVPTPAAHVDRATVLCAACALSRLERRLRAVRAA